MIKNAYVIDFSEFSKEFAEAVEKSFEEDRKNAYERIYIEDNLLEDEYFDWFLLIQKELKEKGYTSEDVILVDNTW
jgi:hypothetical protein